jgi:hypothetical protein
VTVAVAGAAQAAGDSASSAARERADRTGTGERVWRLGFVDRYVLFCSS